MPARSKSIPPKPPGDTRNRVTNAERRSQIVLLKTVGKLAVLRARLWSLHIWLGERPEDADMGENIIPDSVRVSVRGTIECVCTDCLDPALASLQKTALDTPESLAREWRDRLAARRREGGE